MEHYKLQGDCLVFKLDKEAPGVCDLCCDAKIIDVQAQPTRGSEQGLGKVYP